MLKPLSYYWSAYPVGMHLNNSRLLSLTTICLVRVQNTFVRRQAWWWLVPESVSLTRDASCVDLSLSLSLSLSDSGLSLQILRLRLTLYFMHFNFVFHTEPLPLQKNQTSRCMPHFLSCSSEKALTSFASSGSWDRAVAFPILPGRTI